MAKMQRKPSADFHYSEAALAHEDARVEIKRGLAQAQKSIHPKYFYDTRGSELFEKITRLPEYYPTVTETGIFEVHANDIAECCGTGSAIVEPGSGNSEKIRYLLDALRPSAYVGLDIAGNFLQEAADKLASEYPRLDVYALRADFQQLDALPEHLDLDNKLIFYPGSTIGNMEPPQAIEFLKKLRGWLNADDCGLLVGIDLHKETHTLEAAYNDEQGVTAAFNKNILRNVNSIIDSNFDVAQFTHRAVYDAKARRIEMYLDSQARQEVEYADGSLVVEKGEAILTEYSYKYTQAAIAELAHSAGFALEKMWQDREQHFSVSYMVPV